LVRSDYRLSEDFPDQKMKKREKRERRAKLFSKVRFTLIQWKPLATQQETKMTTQG